MSYYDDDRRYSKRIRDKGDQYENQSASKKQKTEATLEIPKDITNMIVSYLPYRSIRKGEFDIHREYSYKYLGNKAFTIFKEERDIHGWISTKTFEQTIWDHRIRNLRAKFGTAWYGMNLLEDSYKQKIEKSFRNKILVKIFKHFEIDYHPSCRNGLINLITTGEISAEDLNFLHSHWNINWIGKIKNVLYKHNGKNMITYGTGVVAAKILIEMQKSAFIEENTRNSANELYRDLLKNPAFKACVDMIKI